MRIRALSLGKLTAIIAVVVTVGWWLTPPKLVNAATIPKLPENLETWIAASEQAVNGEYQLIPGTEKRVRWQTTGNKTEYSIVYLHGFSATRQEIAPTTEIVADRLNANLYETRLSGHGHRRLPMDGVRAEQWLQDGVEAIRIGAALGDKVVVIGTSTGATLALALSGHPVMDDVAALILISPNMAPADPTAAWLTRPAGPLMARLVVGNTRSWTPHNELQARYWSTSYPIDATVEVMRLVDRAQRLTSTTMSQDVLMLLSPEDKVISPQAARDAFDVIDAPRKNLVQVRAEDPSNHVLAGDILSPGTTHEIAEQIVSFITSKN
ncbi:MAG: lysophospholipase [Gammaproteobacteria bacterium]|nr:lysophospholipase [Gammaproteobacteria bacterium]